MLYRQYRKAQLDVNQQNSVNTQLLRAHGSGSLPSNSSFFSQSPPRGLRHPLAPEEQKFVYGGGEDYVLLEEMLR